jgi:hypothetical protein
MMAPCNFRAVVMASIDPPKDYKGGEVEAIDIPCIGR